MDGKFDFRRIQEWTWAACFGLLLATAGLAQQTADAGAPSERLAELAPSILELVNTDPDQALKLSEEAFQLLQQHPDQQLELQLLTGVAFALVSTRQSERALAMVQRALPVARKLEEIFRESTLLRIASIAHRNGGNQEKAIESGLAAAALAEDVGDISLESSAVSAVASAYWRAGQLASALDYFQRAYRLLEDGPLTGQATALNNIGSVLHRMGRLEEGLTYHRRSVDLARQIGEPLRLARHLRSWAIPLLEASPEEALAPAEEAKQIFEQLGATYDLAVAAGVAAEARLKLGRLQVALETFNQIYGVFEERGDYFMQATVLKNQATIFSQTGRTDLAIAKLEEALGLVAGGKARQVEQDLFQFLATVHEDAGSWQQALVANQRAEEIETELFDEQNSRRMAELRAEFDAERREQEIESLRQQQARDALERRALMSGLGMLAIIFSLLLLRYRQQLESRALAEEARREREVSERLREVDKVKDEFLAHTSHELRTPLYGIVGMAESLLDAPSGAADSSQDALRTIVASGQRLGHLVNDILDFSQLRERRLALSLSPVNLASSVDVVLTLSKPLLGDQVTLSQRLPADLPPVLADEQRVEQILHNLVGNAIKFTESGEVIVSAEARDDEFLAVSVSDTGIGIAEELQDKIFDSFEQGGNLPEHGSPGTGLGLAVTRQLVELHGGSIRVESQPGQGATFTFTLPMAENGADFPLSSSDESLASSDHSLPSTAPPSTQVLIPRTEVLAGASTDSEELRGTGEEKPQRPAGEPISRILIIDDEPVVRQVLIRHLQLAGHQILVADSGAKGIDLIQQEKVDLVLLDIMMPAMSGYEVCRQLRQRFGPDELPILLLSAKNRLADRLAAFREGGNDYLAKPIARHELLARVEIHLRLLESNRARAQEVKVLRGLLSICASCKKIRDERGAWQDLETYIDDRSEAAFTHALCPDCVPEFLDEEEHL